MSSTLRPGKTSDKVQRLRNEALREMNAPDAGSFKAGVVSFDRQHDVTRKDFDMDYPKDVPQYQGPNSPHVGNGSGGEQ